MRFFKSLNGILLFILIITIITTQLVGFFRNNEFNNDVNLDDREFMEGTIAFGYLDYNGNIIDNGSTITLDNKGSFNTTLQLNHNLQKTRNYLLIVFNNFKQTAFNVGGEKHYTYSFEMEPDSTMDLPIEIKLDETAKELDLIIIKKPDYKLKEIDMNKASILQEVLPVRYSIDNNSRENEFVYSKSDNLYKEGPNDFVFISKDPNKMKFIPIEEENKDLHLSVGNITNKELTYAVIQLLDWKQIPFEDGEFIKFFNVKEGERKTKKFKIPNTDKEKNLQILAFPYPFNVTRNNFRSQAVFGSLRLTVRPEENTSSTKK
ncbi:hypothetical protein [Pontibacillus litoralis]|uniref:Uncharacterized protein n=1 Tax=Pontibacillus litoralis JSM 072002 TaxID=1385512 RepID=A0A0A5G3W6_9BACI|nr:hypothetical protein [Pontibacillus litoralis]KGX85785.1 hypothetical protein N784_07920 [Pontibacillus litoralis JSM 072002]